MVVAWLYALVTLPLSFADDIGPVSARLPSKAAHRGLLMPSPHNNRGGHHTTMHQNHECSRIVISENWLSFGCDAAGVFTPEVMNRLQASNAMEPSFTKEHHPIFSQYKPWNGTVPPGDSRLLVDFLGFTVPRDLFCNPSYLSQPLAHALRARQCDIFPQVHNQQTAAHLQTAWPVVSEEYFEYVDVLSAAADYASEGPGGTARRPFCFVELGAGYGHWTFAAHKALQQVAAGAPHRYLMVDVVPSLKKAVEELQTLNGVAPGAASFHVGYVAASDSNKGLNRAQLKDASHNVKVYSEIWGTGHTKDDQAAVSRTVSLQTLFKEYALPPCVDMLDVDIQGSEYADFRGHKGLFFGTDSITLMNKRVRRVHIGLHDGRAGVHIQNLIQMFKVNKWRQVWYENPTGKLGPGVPPGNTSWGPIEFGDGILSYINENPELQCPLKSEVTPEVKLIG